LSKYSNSPSCGGEKVKKVERHASHKREAANQIEAAKKGREKKLGGVSRGKRVLCGECLSQNNVIAYHRNF